MKTFNAAQHSVSQHSAAHAARPADDASEEAARALQTALDRRDNGGSPTK
ncbi:hypothetical protein [Actinomadura sp. 9N407]